MNLDIAFGQYCEGRSILHRLDPRAKIIAALLYIVVIFLADTLASFALLLASAVLLVALSGISPRIVIRGMKPLVFIILFTVVVNIFWMEGKTLLWEWGFLHIYAEGLINALLIALRILLLLVGTSIFMTYTTSKSK